MFAQPDADSALRQLRAVVDQLAPYAPTVAERLQSMENDVLAYTDFPVSRTGPRSGRTTRSNA